VPKGALEDGTKELLAVIDGYRKALNPRRACRQLGANAIDFLNVRPSAVLQKYYFHLTFASLRSWEEGRRSPHPHAAAILEKS
jgi:hypothetical protein